jgi:hypothetical protein
VRTGTTTGNRFKTLSQLRFGPPVASGGGEILKVIGDGGQAEDAGAALSG